MTPEELIDDPDFITRLTAELNAVLPAGHTFSPYYVRWALREALMARQGRITDSE